MVADQQAFLVSPNISLESGCRIKLVTNPWSYGLHSTPMKMLFCYMVLLERETDSTEDPTHVEGQTGNRTLWSGQGCPHRRDGVYERTRQFGENSPISPPSPPPKKNCRKFANKTKKQVHLTIGPLPWKTQISCIQQKCAQSARKCAEVRGTISKCAQRAEKCAESARKCAQVRGTISKCAQRAQDVRAKCAQARGSVRNPVLTTACLKSRSGGSG